MTDQEFGAIVADATKRIEGNIRWEERPQHAGVQEFRVPIHSDTGYPLFLIGRYNDAIGKLTYAIIHQSEGRIYALDLGAQHRNPPAPQGGPRELLTGTHKHYWTEQHRDKWAYRPGDITASWNRPLAVWQQFCAEAHIDHRGNLQPPAAQGNFPI